MRRSSIFILLALTLFSMLSIASVSNASNEPKLRVNNFHALLQPKSDGSMTVKETFIVESEGVSYKRKEEDLITRLFHHSYQGPKGIYRSISTRIQGRHAYYNLMDFKMIEARMDGKPIEFEVQVVGNWFTNYIYLLPENSEIPPGIHEFSLTYETDRHVSFGPEFDEVFWWAFGEGSHGWAKVGGTIALTVELPAGGYGIVRELDEHRWNEGTGKVPELLKRAKESDSGTIHYAHAISEKKGYLSVVLSMPKGVIDKPDFDHNAIYFLRDMKAYIAGIIALSVFFLYYLIVWAKAGRDPEKGAIVALYTPPKNCSPAVARVLVRMGYDRKTFTAALLSLASKKAISINDKDGGFELKRLFKPSQTLYADERVLLDALFGNADGNSVPLDAWTIHRAYKKHKKHLKTAFGSKFYVKNAMYVLPGLFLSLIVSIINSEIVDVRDGYVSHLTAIGFWTVFAGYFTRVLKTKRALSLMKPSRGVYAVLFVPTVLYALAVLLGHSAKVFEIQMFMFTGPIFIMMTAHVVFYYLLRAPTPLGRIALDKVEGFREYLSRTEGDRMDRMTPPEETPELFEAYLPYALALDVEHRWAEGFGGNIAEEYTLPHLDMLLSFVTKPPRQ